MIEERLEALGVTLPQATVPMGSYVSVQWAGDLLFLSGAGPLKDGKPTCTGKLGKEVSLEQGRQAAREAAINLLAALKKELGNLDRVVQIVKLLGFVASDDAFCQQATVINGASDFFVEVFGEKGKHARSAIGTNVLPFYIPVEIEAVVRVNME